MFELNGRKYSLEEVQAKADESGLSLEEYITKTKLTKVEEDTSGGNIYKQDPELTKIKETLDVNFNDWNPPGEELSENKKQEVYKNAALTFDNLQDLGSKGYPDDVLDKESTTGINMPIFTPGGPAASALATKISGDIVSKLKKEVFQAKPWLLKSGIIPRALLPNIATMGIRDGKEVMSKEEQMDFDAINDSYQSAARDILSTNGEQPTDVDVQQYLIDNKENKNLINTARDLYIKNSLNTTRDERVEELTAEEARTGTPTTGGPKGKGEVWDYIDETVLQPLDRAAAIAGLVSTEETEARREKADSKKAKNKLETTKIVKRSQLVLGGLEGINKEIKKLTGHIPQSKEEYDGIVKRLEELTTQYESYVDEYQKLSTEAIDMGKANDELNHYIDVVGRNQGWLINPIGGLASSTIRLVNGTLDLADKLTIEGLSTLADSNLDKNNWFREVINNVSGSINMAQNEVYELADNIDKQLKTPISVGDIKTWSEFGEWSAHLIGTQAPNTAVMLTTGGWALPLLGASAAGSSFRQMEQEIELYGAEYTPLQMYMVALGTGFAEALSEKVTLGQLNRVKKGLRNNSDLKIGFGNYFKKLFTAQGKKQAFKETAKYTQDTFEEGFSEVLAGYSQRFLEREILGKDVDVFEGMYDEFMSGAFMSGVVYKSPGIGLKIANAFRPASSNQRIGEIQKDIKSLSKQIDGLIGKPRSNIARSELIKIRDQKVTEIHKIMAKDFANMDKMTQAEQNDLMKQESSIYNLKVAYDQVNNDSEMSDKNKVNALDNLNAQYNIIIDKKNRLLADVNVREEIQKTEEINKQVDGKNVQVIETNEAYNNLYDKDRKKKSKGKSIEQIEELVEGHEKDGILVLNKEAMLESARRNNGNIATGSHELLHKVLKSQFADVKNGNVLKDKFMNFLKQNDIDAYDAVEERMNSRYDKTYAENNPDEYLTQYFSHIKENNIDYNKIDKTFLDKISDFFSNIFGTAAQMDPSNIKFKDGRDVYNFIQDYAKGVKEGKVSDRVVGLTKAGEGMQTGVKQSKAASDRVQQIYEAKGIDGSFEIIEEYKPMAAKLASRFRDVPGYDVNKDILIDEILTGKRGVIDLIREFKPEQGVPLAAYINKYLKSRSIEVGNRILDTVFKSDVTEARNVTATETAEDTIIKKEIEKKIPKTKTLRQKLKIEKGGDVYNKITDSVVKTLGTKLPSVGSGKLKKALRDGFFTELKPTLANLMGTRDSYTKFLKENRKDIIKQLSIKDLVSIERNTKPENRIFTTVVAENVPPKKLREYIEAGYEIEYKSETAGPTVYKKSTPTEQQWLDFYDITGSKKGTRKDKLAELLGAELALDATMPALKDKNILDQLIEKYEIQDLKVPNNIVEEIALQINRDTDQKFSISPAIVKQLATISQAKTIQKVIKDLDLGSVTVTQENRPDKIVSVLKGIIKGKIPSMVFKAGRLSNFGRKTVYGNNNKTYDTRKKAKEQGIENPKKYFVTQEGKYILSTLPIEVSGVKSRKDWVPARGSLYYSVTDPAYEVALKSATINDTLYPDLKKPLRIKLEGRITKEFKEKNKQKSKDNMQALKQFATILSDAVNKGFKQKDNTIFKMSIEDAALFITSGYQATSGIIKVAADFRYVDNLFEHSIDKKGRTIEEGAKFREEHNTPASVIGATLISAIKNNNVEEIFPYIEKNFYQIQLSKKQDDLYNDGFGKTLPEGASILDNPIWRPAAAGIDVNRLINPMNDKTMAEEFDAITLVENAKYKTLTAREKAEFVQDQNTQIIEKAKNPKYDAKKAGKFSLALAPGKARASLKNEKTFGLKLSKAKTTSDQIKVLGDYDKAAQKARSLKTPQKGISVFDFDDTLAKTNSKVLYELPNGKTGTLSATEFAIKSRALEDAGAIFDFSEFNKVVEGKKGPLADLALKRQGKFGSKDIFILTARPQESAQAIKAFLDGIGLSIPLDNITGLEDGTPTAKATWVAEKAAEGYNDFYFADDAIKNVKAVKEILNQIDVKSDVQQAKFSKSKRLNDEFNIIIEKKTGLGRNKQYSPARAKTIGATKGKFNFFIPNSAEDFVGLMYKLLGKGKEGDAQMAWLKKHLLDPFNRAEATLTRDKVGVANDFKELKKKFKTIPKTLKKQAVDGFTYENALRVYIWNKQGVEIPGLAKKDINELISFINNNVELQGFASELIKIQKGKPYPPPTDTWLSGTLTTDIIGGINNINRAEYLQEWQENADIIFSPENMVKLEAAYGESYVSALKNILNRMKTGTNKSNSGSKNVDELMTWVNGSIGAIMFLNTRSAVLQTISAVNFINWSDNNPLKAGAAFANQPQYWKDFMRLFNSDFLVSRRKGLKINVTESEIADAAEQGSVQGVISMLLKKGFIFTQIADSFAIASGGSTFYRNRLNKLVKDGMSKEAAEKQAFLDFYAIAEESQQSSRTDRISAQQASAAGRLILAFGNTPMQYARLIKKGSMDLVNGRGDWKTNVSKIIYYGVVQNVIFNALQNALFTMLFDDDDEIPQDKAVRVANGMMDSLLRGLGIGGAVISTVKNIILKVYQESQKSRSNYDNAALEILKLSPPISSKISKLRAAGRTFDWNADEIQEKGFSLDNPAYLAGAQILSAGFNIPLDRVIKKGNNIADALSDESEYWQKIALLGGWAKWELEVERGGGESGKRGTTTRGTTTRKTTTRGTTTRGTTTRR